MAPLVSLASGINALTGADGARPAGGAPFHDNRVKLTPLP